MDNQIVIGKSLNFIYINFVESELDASIENEGEKELLVHIFLDQTEPGLKAEFEHLEDKLLITLDIRIMILAKVFISLIL
jgi:hypothetical protein